LLAALPRVELTLLIGVYAQRWALGERAGKGMGETVRRWREFLPERLVLPHPSWRNTAWLAKNPWFEEEVAPFLSSRVAEILA
jgi:uracil-DNA glycosylase